MDKPPGPSSNQVLQHAKRLFGAVKAGHAGTLDPLASGLLPILFGEATKFASYLSDSYKVYHATLLLGVVTATGDVAGEVLEWRSSAGITADAIASAVAHYRGEIMQTPPMYSALKHAGTPLYVLARRGDVVQRPPRAVVIDDIAVVGIEGDEVQLHVRCSKGTYIRVLAEDIGTTLGCGATLKRLRRLAVGTFDVRNAVSFDLLESASEAQRLQRLLSVDAGLMHIPAARLSAEETLLVLRGQAVSAGREATSPGIVRLYEQPTGRFLGLGHCTEERLRPIRLVYARRD